MAWTAVPNLVEGRDQANKRFPLRRKSAEGMVGDLAHQASSSSHNPDLTGKPEYRDGDAKDEVRAWDFDAVLNSADGVTMEDVVQMLVKRLRAGDLWHIRYIIYNKRIWHRRDGFVTRQYTGSDPHTSHAHINSDFTQEADEVTGTNWHFDTLGLPVIPPSSPLPPTTHPVLRKGDVGVYVERVQSYLRNTYPTYRNSVFYMQGKLLVVDGKFGGQTEAWVKEFQKRCGLTRDGIIGPKTLGAMRARGYKY